MSEWIIPYQNNLNNTLSRSEQVYLFNKKPKFLIM